MARRGVETAGRPPLERPVTRSTSPAIERSGALGILGGMGPLATVDFFARLVAATPARSDAEHVPVLIASLPQIPPRVPAILGDAPSPLAALRDARDRLIAGGATLIVMPCNTAHHWYAEVSDGVVPMLHIADTALADLRRLQPPPAKVGLLATEGTLASGFYQSRLKAAGYTTVLPTEAEQADTIAPAIAAVKAGELLRGGSGFADAMRKMVARGAEVVILACTEVPPALAAVGLPTDVRSVDSTESLARASVAAWRAVTAHEAHVKPDSHG